MVKHDNITQIGRQIKELRVFEGLTVQTLADKAGISKGMLSRIENGRIIPSLHVTIKLIEELQCPLGDFFQKLEHEDEQTYILLKSGDRKKIDRENKSLGFNYFFGLNASSGPSSFEVNFLVIDPENKREKVTTDAHELKFMIRGKVDYHLDEEVITLEKGDLLYYNGNIPHVPINTSNEPAEMLVIYFYK
ncbi:helix-turn-helix domain-containing protein [Crocinitomix catalasitica]|uniref:helix-turn-helix domain-containing protein n=1 Tax=Crocinitomix catalasitica TaxID=184607 RepID=UPI000481A047|nr:helix-turn-helix domain-containing protein [Crocinitomix catalasitica]